MASIGELFLKLGFEADENKIKDVKKGFGSLRKELLLVQAAFIGAVVGLERFVNSSLKGVVALQNLSNQTGLAIEELQKWQQAGQLSNLALSADQIAQSIATVQKNLAQIRLGGGNIAPFNLLGIDIGGKNAFQVLEELRNNIQDIDPATRTNLIEQIGLTPDFINILKLSRKEFELLSENTFLNKRQRGDIDRLGTSFKKITLNLKALKDQAVAKLAPLLNDIAQDFFQFLIKNGDKIIKTIASLARGFANFAKAVGSALSVTAKFIENILGFENGLKVLSGAFIALTLSFSPLLAGLAAIILLLDDISIFKKGGESVIGDLIKAFGELPDFAKVLGGGALVVFLTGVLKPISLIAASVGLLAKNLSLIKGLGGIVGVLGAGAFLKEAGSLGEKGATKLDKTDLGQSLGGGLLNIRDFLDKVTEPFQELSSLLSPLAFGGGGGATTINNNVSINGIQDPSLVANEVNRSLISSGDELKRIQGQQNFLK